MRFFRWNLKFFCGVEVCETQITNAGMSDTFLERLLSVPHLVFGLRFLKTTLSQCLGGA